MEKNLGKPVWIFTDGNRPAEGSYREKGHESIIVLNMNNVPAEIDMTLYFPDKPPIKNKKLIIGAETRAVFPHRYFIRYGWICCSYWREVFDIIESSNVNVVAQYGILDPIDQPLHFYTVMGYPCE